MTTMQPGSKTGVRALLTALGICSCLPLSHAQTLVLKPSAQLMRTLSHHNTLLVKATSTPVKPTATSTHNSLEDNRAPAVTGLRLADLYRAALPHQARLRAADAAIRSAQTQIDMAKAQQRPAISLSASRLNNRLESTAPNFLGQINTTQDRYGSSNQTLTLRQPIYRPALTAGVRSAQAQALAIEQQKEQEINAIAAYLGSVYFDLLMAQSQKTWASVQVQARRSLWDTLVLTLAAGSGTVTDVEDARARLDLALADQADAHVYQSMTEQQLSMLLGSTTLPTIAPAHPSHIADLLTPEEQQAQYWIDTALENNSEIQQLVLRQQAAQKEIARAQAGHHPTLDLLIQRTRSGNENVTRIDSSYDNTSIGLQLNIPIYAGGYVSAQVRQAVAEHEKASAAVDIAKADLSTRVFKEYRSMAENMARYAALQQAQVSARTALRSTQMAQEAGLKSRSDVALAQLQLATTEFESQKIIYQALLAKLRLNLLTAKNEQAVETAVEQVERWLYSATPKTPSTVHH